MTFAPPPRIRPIAIGVVLRGDSILVFEARDNMKQQTFYRPLGGAIEFGELGSEALAREFREELGAELTDIEFLGALENRFHLEGAPGHEIVLVYRARFGDTDFYRIEETTAYEDVGVHVPVRWMPLADFGAGGLPLYPDGLLELIAAS